MLFVYLQVLSSILYILCVYQSSVLCESVGAKSILCGCRFSVLCESVGLCKFFLWAVNQWTQWVYAGFQPSVDAGFLYSMNQWVYVVFLGCESMDPMGICRFAVLCGYRFTILHELVGLCRFFAVCE